MEYPVFQITEEMVLQDEPMGSKDKRWCELPPEMGGGVWLFKEPRLEEGKIEHLAEKIAQEIGGLIRAPCARVDLAVFNGRKGTISKSFLEEGEALVHGNEIIAGRVDEYDKTAKRRTVDHTYERIRKGIQEACGGGANESLAQFAGYLVLDALIGNTDRHHENWALVRRDGPQGAAYRLAPSFDHASSLGREMRDDRRASLLAGNRVAAYLRGGRGAIYLSEHGETAIAPLNLVEHLAKAEPGQFGPWLKRIENVTDGALEAILNRIPEGWVSRPQREFAKALVLQAKEVLSQIQS